MLSNGEEDFDHLKQVPVNQTVQRRQAKILSLALHYVELLAVYQTTKVVVNWTYGIILL